MKNRRPTVFRFVLQAHAVAVSGMSAAETGNYFRALLRDLECGKGSTPQATEMIDCANHISEISRVKGLASAKARLAADDDPNNLSPAAPPRHSPPAATHVPTMEQILSHAATIGLPESEAKAFFDYWQGAHWTENNGIPVLNWRKKMSNWKTNAAERKALDSARPGSRPNPRRPEKSTYDKDDPLFGDGDNPPAPVKS